MLNYIKANYRAGDSIEITSSEGVFTGNIEYVTDKFIILRQPNGQICGIAAAKQRGDLVHSASSRMAGTRPCANYLAAAQ